MPGRSSCSCHGKKKSKLNISLSIDARRPLACRTLSSSPSEARLPTGGAGSWAATDGLEAVPPKLTWGLATHIEARERNRMNLEKGRHGNNGLASHTFKFQRYLIVLFVICDAPLFVNGSLGMDGSDSRVGNFRLND